MKASLVHYSSAGYPAVCINTQDEDRAIASIVREFPNHTVLRIGAVSGLADVKTGQVLDERGSYPSAFARIAAKPDHLLVVLDYQHIIKNAQAYRTLRDTLPRVKASGSMIVLLAPCWQLPAELEHDLPVIEDSLPTREELGNALEVCTDATKTVLTDDHRQSCVDALTGCTLAEAENAAALVYAATGSYSPGMLVEEKLKVVRQSGKLEISMPASLEELGGLSGYREYVEHEVIPSAQDPEMAVRGIMFVGPAGTGKSLLARITGSILKYPVLRCDISALKGSLVGQSEQSMRAALKLAEAVAPCVLYLDEIEKALGGYASSAQTDSGVTLSMVGTLLTWLQEHTARVLTIATCNDYAKLPAELTRAGRFDERFFVDLPCLVERQEIAVAIGRRLKVDPHASFIAELSEGWTGAEIEQLIRSAARRTQRNLTPEAIQTCALEIKPISKVRSAEITALRDWGKANLRLANTPEASPVKRTRKIDTALIASDVAEAFSGGVA